MAPVSKGEPGKGCLPRFGAFGAPSVRLSLVELLCSSAPLCLAGRPVRYAHGGLTAITGRLILNGVAPIVVAGVSFLHFVSGATPCSRLYVNSESVSWVSCPDSIACCFAAFCDASSIPVD